MEAWAVILSKSLKFKTGLQNRHSQHASQTVKHEFNVRNKATPIDCLLFSRTLFV